MKIKKSILAMVLTAVVGLSVVGCGKSEEKKSTDSAKKTETTESKDQQKTEGSATLDAKKLESIRTAVNGKVTDISDASAASIGLAKGSKKIVFADGEMIVSPADESKMTAKEKADTLATQKTHKLNLTGSTVSIPAYYKSGVLVMRMDATKDVKPIDPKVIEVMDKF